MLITKIGDGLVPYQPHISQNANHTLKRGATKAPLFNDLIQRHEILWFIPTAKVAGKDKKRGGEAMRFQPTFLKLKNKRSEVLVKITDVIGIRTEVVV